MAVGLRHTRVLSCDVANPVQADLSLRSFLVSGDVVVVRNVAGCEHDINCLLRLPRNLYPPQVAEVPRLPRLVLCNFLLLSLVLSPFRSSRARLISAALV